MVRVSIGMASTRPWHTLLACCARTVLGLGCPSTVIATIMWGRQVGGATPAATQTTARPRGLRECNSAVSCLPPSRSASHSVTVYRIMSDMGTYSIGDLNATWSKNGSRGSCPPTELSDVMPYCGYEGRIMNMLHSPRTMVHIDRYPLYAPAMWIGECYSNGTTKHGWTHQKFKARKCAITLCLVCHSPSLSAPNTACCLQTSSFLTRLALRGLEFGA